MLKIKKMIAVVMVFLLLFSAIQNIVQAVTFNQDVNIYKIGDCEYTLQYWKEEIQKWSYIICTYVVYQENGKTYPAYCLNRELDGVGQVDSYDVNLESLIDDDRVWRTVINGFPYKSAAELGVYNDFDAFMATKQAIYCILYDWDVETRFRGGNERGTQIFEAMKRMVHEGRYGTYTPQSANVTVNKVGQLKDEGDYYSQEYSVSSIVETSLYTITNVINCPSGAYTSDLNNNAKTTFNGGEHFKIRIPKSSMGTDIDLKITVRAKCKTYPVFFGRTYLAGTQNYLITTDPYGDEGGQGTLNIDTGNAKIVINKKDKSTNEPIPNTTFQLTKTDGTVVANATTNSNGVAEFTGLYQNDYILKEIKANDKYILEANRQNVSIKYGETKTYNITNNHKLGNLKVFKVDKDNNQIAIGGVSFDLFSKEQNKVIGTYTTDVNGEIFIKDLRIGDYSLIEKNSNKWYNLADDTDVKVEWNTTTNQTIENELKKGQVKIIKVDKDNNEIRLEGVKFEVLDENKKVLETIVTDSNGEALTSQYPIRDYSKLYLRETETLDAYALNDEIKEIVLEENQIKTIQFENEVKKGKIKVIKVDKDNNEVKLDGVTFEVYDENNNLIETIVTDKDGEATTKELPISLEYTVKETITKNTYVLSEETKTVKLEQNQITTLTFENEKKKGQIEIIKVDEEDNEVKLEGVVFEILNEDGEIIETITTDDEGRAITKFIPIDTEYTVREKETKKEYVLSEETVKVVLEENEIKSITFENKKKKGTIKILKVSNGYSYLLNMEDGTPLPNTQFTVVDSNDEIVGVYETGEDGTIELDVLYGEYTIYESGVPEGFLMDAEPQTVFMNEDGQVIELTFKDTPIQPELPKTGIGIDITATLIFIIGFSIISIICLIINLIKNGGIKNDGNNKNNNIQSK